MWDSVGHLGSGGIGDVPDVVIAFVVHVRQSRITWVQCIHAIGDAEGSRRVSIPVDKVLVSIHVISSMPAGTSAVVLSGSTNAAYATTGNLIELSPKELAPPRAAALSSSLSETD